VFCTFLALVLCKELLDQLAACGAGVAEWQCIIDDLDPPNTRGYLPSSTPLDWHRILRAQIRVLEPPITKRWSDRCPERIP
jgi:hypothetical protein